METFPMVAKTFQGLEEVLAQELIVLGAQNVEIGNRMVSFEGDLRLMYRANLGLRTALSILKPIAKFTAEDPDELYELVRNFDWTKYLDVDSTFSVDATVSGQRFTHSRFVVYRTKDGIADFFNEKFGKRPSVCIEGADIQLNVHIADNRVTISLDSSGEPLCKRGYKVEQTEAPINEVLAAGIILMSGWRGDVDFVDPMCGSGTFLTEAALIAANINPGIYRKNFAFEKWADFDEELFEELYNDDSAEKEVHCKISGGDKDATAVAIARANIRNAHLENIVTVDRMDIEEWTDNGEEGVLVTNPPYGRRLRPGDMDSLWSMIGRCLKNNFKGWHAWIIGMNDEQFTEIGLKPSVKVPLHNGALECSLREFVMFAGKYNDFRADGGSVSHKNRDLEESLGRVTRGRHLSDKEWGDETRKYGSSKPKKFREGREERGGGYKSRPDRKDRDSRDSREFRSKEFKGKEFKSGKRDFKSAGRDNRRDDRDFKSYGRDSRRDDAPKGKGFKGGGFKRGEARKISDKGPSLSADNEVRFYEPGMRGRRRVKFRNDPDEDFDD